MNSFEIALQRSTSFNDSEIPDYDDTMQVLETLANKNSSISSEKALTQILNLIQLQECNQNWNFFLKVLVILEFCVENKLQLNKISNLDIIQFQEYHDIDQKISKYAW